MASGHGGRNQPIGAPHILTLSTWPQWGPATEAGISSGMWWCRVRPDRGLNGVRPRRPESGLAENRACDLGVYRAVREVVAAHRDAAVAQSRDSGA
jgi:hypothetical protein